MIVVASLFDTLAVAHSEVVAPIRDQTVWHTHPGGEFAPADHI